MRVEELINKAFISSVTAITAESLFFLGKFMGIIDLAELTGYITMEESEFLIDAHNFAKYGTTF